MIFLVISLTKKTKQNFFKEYLIIHYMNTLLVFLNLTPHIRLVWSVCIRGITALRAVCCVKQWYHLVRNHSECIINYTL